MMDGLTISIPQRLFLLRIVLILSLSVSVFLTPSLWAGYRYFPAVPAVSLPVIPAPYDMLLIGAVLLFWMCSLFMKKQRLFIFIAFVASTYLALLDLNRLQPWFYIYNVMLLVFVFYSGRVDDPNKFTSIFIILQLMFASVYFYAGLSRFNASFANEVFPELIKPLSGMMSERQFLFFRKIGRLVPAVLMFMGLGFVISPIRYLSIALAVLVHVLLLIFLFPSPQNTNYALWFSNLVFLVMAILLFSGKTKQRYFSPTFLFKMPLFYVLTLLFLVAPAFNTVNRWPDFLSFNFRSGNNNGAVLTLSPEAQQKLPYYLRSFCKGDAQEGRLDYQAWASHELGADCFPANAVFMALPEHLHILTGAGVKDIQLELRPKADLLVKP